MTPLLVLYWVPGAHGDWLQSILLQDPKYLGVVSGFSTSRQGRIIPTMDQYFLQNFAHDASQWYWREWTAQDCALIRTRLRSDKILVLPTHDRQQVQVLRQEFCQCLTVGITYPDNFWPLILKNWCVKVGFDNATVKKIYDKPLHQMLRQKGVFDEFLLGEQVKFGSAIPKSICCDFDICIDLERLYAGDSSDLHQLLDWNDQIEAAYQLWLETLPILYRYHFAITDALAEALGSNKLSHTTGHLSAALDRFDQRLIKSFCKSLDMTVELPDFHTLAQADDFFRQHVC